MGVKSAAIHCIADDSGWLDAIKAKADSPVVCVNWVDFDSAPLDFASPDAIAVAFFSDCADQTDQRLGKLCRSFPTAVVIELAEAFLAADEQFFAHGFQKIQSVSQVASDTAGSEPNSLPRRTTEFSADLCRGERVFEYRLRDYKAVPPWLNSRFWAHPERFHL